MKPFGAINFDMAGKLKTNVMGMIMLAVGWIILFNPSSGKTAEIDIEQPCVILLHGLGRTSRSMKVMAQSLEQEGFSVANIDYPSRDYSIEKLAMKVIPEGVRQCESHNTQQIHFVTHSMGGILVRYYLSKNNINRLGRVVMLSPPNRGSEVADALKENAFYKWMNGPAGQQLGTDPDTLVNQLGPVPFSVGIITGNTHALFDGWFADLIPGQDDGKVSVERAKVEGMADFLVLPYTHPFIMKAGEVIAQTIHFLRNGRFKHEKFSSDDHEQVEKKKDQ